MSSWINISGLEVNDLICDRTSALRSAASCAFSIVVFSSSISNVSSLRISNFMMKNISLNSSSSSVSYLSAVYFSDALVSVRKISFESFLVRNIQTKNTIGFCQSRLIQFKSSVSCGVVKQENADSSEFSIRDMFVYAFNSSTVGGRSDLRILHVEHDLINYTTVILRNISGVSLNSNSTLAESFVYLASFGASILTEPTSSSSVSTKIEIDSIQLQRVASTARSNSLVHLVYVIKSVMHYDRIQFTNATGVLLNSTSAAGASYLCGMIIEAAVTAPPTESVGSDTRTSSSLTVNSVLWERVSSTGRASSQLFFFYVIGAVSNYSSIRLSDFRASSLSATSAAGASSNYLVNFGTSVKARSEVDACSSSSSSSSLLVVDSIHVRDASSSGNFSTQLWTFFVAGAVENFCSIQITNVSAASLRSTSSSSRASLYLVTFGSTIVAPAVSATSFSSSSLSFKNIHMESAESTGFIDAQIFLHYVQGTVSNYCTIQITNIAAASLNATAYSGRSSLYFVVILSPVSAAGSSKKATSSLRVDNIRIHGASSTSPGGVESQLWIFVVHGIVNNYCIISLSNFTADSLNSSSSSGMSTLYFVNFRSFIAGPPSSITVNDSSSLLQLENILLQNASSTGMSYANLWIFSTVGFIANYSTIRFANVQASSSNADSASGTSHFSLVSLGSAVSVPAVSSSSSSLLLSNFRLQNVSSFSRRGSSQLWLFSADGTIQNYNSIQITNISASSLNSNSSSQGSYLYLLHFSALIFSSPSMLLIDNIRLQGATSTGKTISRVWFIALTGIVFNLSKMTVKNLSAESLKSTALSGGSYVFIVVCFSSVAASVDSSSSPLSSWLLVDNIQIQSASSVGSTMSQMFFFFVGGDATNYDDVEINSIAAISVVVTSSASVTAVATTHVVFVGGLMNCSSLLVDNIQLRNVATASNDASSSISLIFFASWGSFTNISKISLQNSKIEEISISSNKMSVIRIMEAGTDLQAESIIINNNSLVLSGSGAPTPQNIAVAVVAMRLSSSGFSKMDVTNNTLSIRGQFWNQRCSPANCSMLRVNDVQQGNNNNASVISISGNEIVAAKSSSFISFANYSNMSLISNRALLNVVLENNKANFAGSTSVSNSLVSFDSPPPSSPFPSLVSVEVKCNKWPRLIDRSVEHFLLSISSSPSQLDNFISWTCTENSRSKTSSPSYAETSSSSNSLSSSFSDIRTKTNTRDTSSASVSSKRTRSGSRFWNISPFILRISEPVNSALLVSDGTQTAAMVSVAVFASISSSPALGFTIGRQQAMMDFAQKSLRGDCRGLLPSTTIESFENEISNPLGLGNSPTQMSIGGSEKLMSYHVGAVIGNCLLIVGLVALNQGIGIGATKFLSIRTKRIRNFVRKNKIASMLKERCAGFRRRNEPLMKLLRRVFARSYASLTLFFCLTFLLTPTLSSALIILVAAKNDPKLENQQVSGYLKLVSAVCAFVFSLIALYFMIWSVRLRRKRKEKFRSLKYLGLESHPSEKTVSSSLFKAGGEWKYPPVSNYTASAELGRKMKGKVARKYEILRNNFLIAEPAFESYRTSVWFSVVEVATAIALAFPSFFAQFASSAKSSCMIHGILLLIALLIYTTILIWKNPFKLRILRITNPMLSFLQLVIVTISLVFAAKSDGNNETPAWFWRIILIPFVFQSLTSVMMICSAVFPILMFLKKLTGRAQRNQETNHMERDNNNEESSNSTKISERGKLEKRRKIRRSQDDLLESPILGDDTELSQQI